MDGGIRGRKISRSVRRAGVSARGNARGAQRICGINQRAADHASRRRHAVVKCCVAPGAGFIYLFAANRYFSGAPSPLREPEKTDMVIFRENSEDIYTGIEWPAESAAA